MQYNQRENLHGIDKSLFRRALQLNAPRDLCAGVNRSVNVASVASHPLAKQASVAPPHASIRGNPQGTSKASGGRLAKGKP